MKIYQYPDLAQYPSLLQRPVADAASLEATVRRVLDDVKRTAMQPWCTTLFSSIKRSWILYRFLLQILRRLNNYCPLN
ncbi:hypothetical protein [Pseudobacter ginsenosidimutans]|uniref:hypothetical protein n=1 Tax=Pseudobacter ginsenosidimutans TaxID=661488 RepID=UPI001CEFAF1C|nr:hypothetical protein [Pseudobacter ginsenosidimutans]